MMQAHRQTVFPAPRYDDAWAAIAFLELCFGFERQTVHEDPNGKVAHGELRLGTASFVYGGLQYARSATVVVVGTRAVARPPFQSRTKRPSQSHVHYRSTRGSANRYSRVSKSMVQTNCFRNAWLIRPSMRTPPKL